MVGSWTCKLASVTGLLTAHYIYERKSYNSINEDLKASAGLEAGNAFNLLQKNKKNNLVAGIIAKGSHFGTLFGTRRGMKML